MKRFNELTPGQRQEAVEKCLRTVLIDVVEGVLVFDDVTNGDDTQARIDKARAQAERMKTPWFVHEYLMDDPKVGDTLRRIAQADAEDEDTWYCEPGERAVYLDTLQRPIIAPPPLVAGGAGAAHC